MQEKENSELKPAVLRLKMSLCHVLHVTEVFSEYKHTP